MNERGEILSCPEGDHESLLPAHLIPSYAREAWCPTCHMWVERKPENVKADAS